MTHNFGEKTKEYYNGTELPVWQSPKYIESKKKAIEMIESGKYDLCDADFWILMNSTKTNKMAYTGLIISHNGCLKINDKAAEKFKPECVSLDKDGYKDCLVYSYCSAEQGVFEVGEVSAKNCKNEYPYAMALKRLFDRVVLKISKLAFSGIYSDSEADEFNNPNEERKTENNLGQALIDEANTLQIKLEKVAAYNKCEVSELTDEMLTDAISLKKAALAQRESKEQK